MGTVGAATHFLPPPPFEKPRLQLERHRLSRQLEQGGGEPLPHPAEALMRRRLDHDFSHVRVHSGPAAARLADEYGAAALTVGRHIALSDRARRSGAADRAHLLTHELAHVAQNDRAGARAPEALVTTPGDGAEREADAVTERAAEPGAALRVSAAPTGVVARVPEQWYRGQAAGAARSAPGAFMHDLGDGLYLTDDPGVAREYAATRVGELATRGVKTVEESLEVTIERASLGRVLDLSSDSRWKAFLARRMPDGTTIRELMRLRDNYRIFFDAFLRENGLRMEDFDAIIGDELMRRGRQMCVRNPGMIARITAALRPLGSLAGAVTGTGAGPAAPPRFPVATRYNVLTSFRNAVGEVVSEVEIVFGDGVEAMNRASAASGAPEIPARMIVRISQNAEGAVVSASAVTGESEALAAVVARQALAALHAGAAEAGGLAGGTTTATSRGALMAGLRWGGVVLFVAVTAYEMHNAPAGQEARVAAGAAGGFAGGMAGTYLVCNLLLGIETFGASLIICGVLAGGAGGALGTYGGTSAYDAAATSLQR